MDIDYVIAWVNGRDPEHRKARLAFPPDHTLIENEEAVGDVRFIESGEIYYNIASVLQYAPFIRRIFVVTDNQKPGLLDYFHRSGKCVPDFIQIISHDDIFEGLGAARPNFSSLSIEAALWRIPGLAEHFIYANDDLFLNAHVSPRTFFRKGLPVLRGAWCKPERKRIKNIFRSAIRKISGRGPNVNPTFRKSLDAGAIAAGSTTGFLSVAHHPHPLRKSTFETFFSNRPDVLRAQVGHRYRSIGQFNPVSLANHLEILNYGAPINPPGRVAYFDSRKNDFEQNCDRIVNASTLFGCVQSMERLTGYQADEIHGILQQKFKDTLPPEISGFFAHRERPGDGTRHAGHAEPYPPTTLSRVKLLEGGRDTGLGTSPGVIDAMGK